VLAKHSEDLIGELETAVRSGSAETRVGKLREVTSLFLSESNRLNEEQVRIFDNVLCRLSAAIESRALSELGRQLAPVDNAPIEMIGRLARHDEIGVAGPVLTDSKRLSTGNLTEIAREKGQSHLLAISKRNNLETPVTDILVERGDRDVVCSLASNESARFSTSGYGKLAQRAEGDDALSEIVALRRDIPSRLLRDLLARAAESVRAKLLALIPPDSRDKLASVLAGIKNGLVADDGAGEGPSAAENVVRALQSEGRLDETTIFDFAHRGLFAEVAAALALLCSSKTQVISDLLSGTRNDAVLIPCKAANLSWNTAEAILRNRHGKDSLPEQIIGLARNDFGRLTVATAQKTLRFMQVRATVGA